MPVTDQSVSLIKQPRPGDWVAFASKPLAIGQMKWYMTRYCRVMVLWYTSTSGQRIKQPVLLTEHLHDLVLVKRAPGIRRNP